MPCSYYYAGSGTDYASFWLGRLADLWVLFEHGLSRARIEGRMGLNEQGMRLRQPQSSGPMALQEPY